MAATRSMSSSSRAPLSEGSRQNARVSRRSRRLRTSANRRSPRASPRALNRASRSAQAAAPLPVPGGEMHLREKFLLPDDLEDPRQRTRRADAARLEKPHHRIAGIEQGAQPQDGLPLEALQETIREELSRLRSEVLHRDLDTVPAVGAVSPHPGRGSDRALQPDGQSGGGLQDHVVVETAPHHGSPVGQLDRSLIADIARKNDRGEGGRGRHFTSPQPQAAAQYGLGSHLRRSDSRRGDDLAEQVGARADRFGVGARAGEDTQEFLVERGGDVGAAQLPGPRGIAEHLQGLDPGQIGEEPAAGSEHEQRMPLHLEEPPHLARVGSRGTMGLQEDGAPLRGWIEQHIDVGVPRRPGIAEEARPALLEDPRKPAPQRLERLVERSPPLLIPTGLSAGRAPAIRAPALDAVRATPGSSFEDFRLPERMIGVQERGVIGERDVRMRPGPGSGRRPTPSRRTDDDVRRSLRRSRC